MNERLMMPPLAEMIHLQSDNVLYSCSPSHIIPEVIPFDGSHRQSSPEQVTFTLGRTSAGAGVLVSSADVVTSAGAGVLVSSADVVASAGAGVLVSSADVVASAGAGVVLVVRAAVVDVVVGAGVVVLVCSLASTNTTSHDSANATASMLGSTPAAVLAAATNFALASTTEKNELLYRSRAATVT